MSTATEHTIHGKFDEVAGKIKQGVGEAVGNDKVANEGAAQQIKGHAEQAWGTVKGAAEDKAAELKAEHEAKAHDVRESVTSTAQNAKDHLQHAIHGDKA